MRILIVRLSALGDIITSMAALQFIHQKVPHACIDWLVESRFEQVLQYNPHINQIYSINLKKYKDHFFKLIRQMYRQSKKMPQYDLIIDMQGLMKSALLSRFVGKNIVGFDRKSVKETLSALVYKKKISISLNEHILIRNFSLLRDSLGLDLTYDQIMKKSAYLFYAPPKIPLDSFLHTHKKNILVVLGGSWFSKIYPKEKLLEVFRQLGAYHLMLLWSSEEEESRARWLQRNDPKATLLPLLDLNDLKALVAQVDCVLGNDTGPTHMAWALNKPSVTLLGCTSTTRIPINTQNVCVASDTTVNPSKINKKDLSIQDLDPHRIVEKINQLLPC